MWGAATAAASPPPVPTAPSEGFLGSGSCVTMSCFLHHASGVLLGASQDHGGKRNWKWRIQAEMRSSERPRSPAFPAVGVRWRIFSGRALTDRLWP